MLVLWLNWALSIPRSFTEWPVPAAETSCCGPLEVVPCLDRGKACFSGSRTLSLWPTSGGPGFGGGFLVEPEEERVSGVVGEAASLTRRCQSGLQPFLWPGVPLPKGNP